MTYGKGSSEIKLKPRQLSKAVYMIMEERQGWDKKKTYGEFYRLNLSPTNITDIISFLNTKGYFLFNKDLQK